MSGRAAASGTWTWHAGAGSVIWQLMFPGGGVVAGLKRFPEKRRAELFCIDAATGRAISEGFVPMMGDGESEPVGEGWMIGLETTSGNLLYCHTFLPGSPEHQGIWAVDPAGERVVWSRPEAVFAANLESSFLVYRTRMFAGFPEREYWLIEPSTGEVIESLGTGHERPNRLRMSAGNEEELQGILLPESHPAIEGPVEKIETGLLTAEARHRPSLSGIGWSSSLTVRVGGEVVHEGSMASTASAPLFNNFLVRGGSLFYIRENEELVCVAWS